MSPDRPGPPSFHPPRTGTPSPSVGGYPAYAQRWTRANFDRYGIKVSMYMCRFSVSPRKALLLPYDFVFFATKPYCCDTYMLKFLEMNSTWKHCICCFGQQWDQVGEKWITIHLSIGSQSTKHESHIRMMQETQLHQKWALQVTLSTAIFCQTSCVSVRIKWAYCHQRMFWWA